MAPVSRVLTHASASLQSLDHEAGVRLNVEANLDIHLPTDGDRDKNDHNGNDTANVNTNEDDDDDGDVTGPTVEAHVDLAKKFCKYSMAQYC